MEVAVRSAVGLPPGCYVSVGIQNQRVLRQSNFEKPCRFPDFPPETGATLKIEVLSLVGNARVVKQPGAQDYTVSVPRADGQGSMEVELEIKPLGTAAANGSAKLGDTRGSEAAGDVLRGAVAGSEPRSGKGASQPQAGQRGSDAWALECKEYLNRHGVPGYLQSLVKSLLEFRPTDPYAWMRQQLGGTARWTQPQLAVVNRLPQISGGACVITGPSGVGKSTLIKKLMADFPGKFDFSVSHTTRDPRPGEQDGVDYNFTSRDEMEAEILAGNFVEHAEVHGNFYGTSTEAVEKVTRQGKVCLLDIDVQGADSVRKSALGRASTFVFFAPPSMEVLEQRLRGRGSETEEQIQKRLAGASKELSVYRAKPEAWDLTLQWTNEQVDDAYQQFRGFLELQVPRKTDAIAVVRRLPQAAGGVCAVVGPSGVGKSTLIKRLMADFPEGFGFSVSHTTRGPRPGELDGIDYHFVSREKMQKDINDGLFIEHAEVHGNFYGTSLAAVDAVMNRGMVCLLDIDVQGAASVRRSPLSSKASFVFFAPPSMEVLEQRLRGRGTETEERVMKRLAGAQKEMAIYAERPEDWDLTLKWHNAQVDQAYTEFRDFLKRQIPEKEKVPSTSEVPPVQSGLCVVCGPYGVGKSTLIGKLMAEFPGRLRRAVRSTTRDRRPGEIEGVDYHFVTRAAMAAEIKSGGIIEFVEDGGHFYGTSVAAIEDAMREDTVCLLETEVQGAYNVRLSYLCERASFVYFAAPSGEALAQRLRLSGVEEEETIQKALTRARREMSICEERPDAWDFILKWKDEEIDHAHGRFREFIVGQFPHVAQDCNLCHVVSNSAWYGPAFYGMGLPFGMMCL